MHRRHAEMELAIRDLKEGAGTEHVPSGQFFAKGAWLCCAVLAHNLLRWSLTLGRRSRIDELTSRGTIGRQGACAVQIGDGESRPRRHEIDAVGPTGWVT